MHWSTADGNGLRGVRTLVLWYGAQEICASQEASMLRGENNTPSLSAKEDQKRFEHYVYANGCFYNRSPSRKLRRCLLQDGHAGCLVHGYTLQLAVA